MRRRGFVRRNHRSVIDNLPRLCGELGRVHQTVAAHPDRVVRARQIGHEVTPLVVGDDDAREFGWQILRFGDNPDARLGAVRARDDTADVIGIDSNLGRLRRNASTLVGVKIASAIKLANIVDRASALVTNIGCLPAVEPALWPLFAATT